MASFIMPHLNDKSSNDSEKPIKTRFSIVAHFGRSAAKPVVVAALLSSCFYFACVDVGSRPAYIQAIGGVVAALLSKQNK